MAWPRRVDGGGAPAGLGEEDVAPGESGQPMRREQATESARPRRSRWRSWAQRTWLDDDYGERQS